MAGVGAGFWFPHWGFVMELALGVLNVGYDAGDETTFEVAGYLEAKYHVMDTFFFRREEKIAGWLADSVINGVKSIQAGKAVKNIFYDTEQKIESEFRDFLDANEMSTMFYELTESEMAYYLASTGGFTGAAEAGIRSRFLHPSSSKNKPRPVFIDTGLYQSSFRAWMEP